MKILDCTLRDGGYVNNWEFSKECLQKVVDTDKKLKVDIVELGILGKKSKKDTFSTKFADFDEIPQISVQDGEQLYAVMGTINELKEMKIPECVETIVDIIRVAFFKVDYRETIEFAKGLIEKGYTVFLQAMATFMYSEEELEEMLQEVNKVSPHALYIVDSFGTLYPDDVERIYNSYKRSLKDSIRIGFHAHNNIQMALANAIRFIEIADEDCYIDASYGGMGRGAGNLCMELLLRYLYEKKSVHYDLEACFELVDGYITDELKKNYWGYSFPTYYASLYETNAVYVWYLQNRGVNEPDEIRSILKELPDKDRYTLVKSDIEKYLSNRIICV